MIRSCVRLLDRLTPRLTVDKGRTGHYRWLGLITAAVLYNALLVLARAVFWELQNLFPVGWVILDYCCDLIYLGTAL